MDIYARIRSFYEFVETNPMPSSQIALWFALLYTNNRAHWANEFTVASSVLSNRTGLDRKGINRARNSLKQKGLIDFVTNGNKATQYIMRYAKLGMANDMASDMANGRSSDMASDMASDTINKTKTKTKTNISIPANAVIDSARETKISAAKQRFSVPTVADVAAYCKERNNGVDANRWYDYYASKGWVVGKSPMKDWRASVRTWERNGYGNSQQQGAAPIYKPPGEVDW